MMSANARRQFLGNQFRGMAGVAGQRTPPLQGLKFAERDAQGRATPARRAREAEVTTSGEGR